MLCSSIIDVETALLLQRTKYPFWCLCFFRAQLLEHHHHQLSQAVRMDLENILYASLGMSAMVEDLLALFRLETHGLVFSSRPMQTQQ